MNIQIDTSQLERDIGIMQEKLDNLNTAKEQMYRCLEELSSKWEGVAHTTFTVQTRIDQMVLSGLMRNLDNLVECMEYAKSQYIHCNEDVNSKIAGIRISGDT